MSEGKILKSNWVRGERILAQFENPLDLKLLAPFTLLNNSLPS